ncbi:MAG TPA: GreA/GreB family elongation factor, partial [Chthoniobacterales bacterium]
TEGPVRPEFLPALSVLPPGARNLMTPAGAERLRAELERLVQDERPRLLAVSDDPEAQGRLGKIDQRIFQLEQSLQTAEVVKAPEGPATTVTFGSTVVVRGPDGEETFRIVGVDETDHARGCISWLSPVARALMNAKVGQQVRFKYPCGEENLEVIALTYES